MANALPFAWIVGVAFVARPAWLPVVATGHLAPRVRVCFPVAGVAVGDYELSGSRGFVPGAHGDGSSHVAVHLVFSLLVLDDPEVSRGAS